MKVDFITQIKTVELDEGRFHSEQATRPNKTNSVHLKNTDQSIMLAVSSELSSAPGMWKT